MTTFGGFQDGTEQPQCAALKPGQDLYAFLTQTHKCLINSDLKNACSLSNVLLIFIKKKKVFIIKRTDKC